MYQAVDDSSLGCIKDELPAESEDEQADRPTPLNMQNF